MNYKIKQKTQSTKKLIWKAFFEANGLSESTSSTKATGQSSRPHFGQGKEEEQAPGKESHQYHHIQHSKPKTPMKNPVPAKHHQKIYPLESCWSEKLQLHLSRFVSPVNANASGTHCLDGPIMNNFPFHPSHLSTTTNTQSTFTNSTTAYSIRTKHYLIENNLTSDTKNIKQIYKWNTNWNPPPAPKLIEENINCTWKVN